jgi:competence ComEA-like helix-hairpin-helix protein
MNARWDSTFPILHSAVGLVRDLDLSIRGKVRFEPMFRVRTLQEEETLVDSQGHERGVTMREIDLNTASREDLMEVPGVSYIMADNIIGFREEHGAITSVEDLRELPGMDETTLEELRAASSQAGESEWTGEIVEEEEEEEW